LPPAPRGRLPSAMSYDLAGRGQVGGGRISYHATVGFTYSLINLLSPYKTLEISRIAAELYARCFPPQGLTLELWQRDFALACGVAYKRSHLTKGIYTIPLGRADVSIDLLGVSYHGC